jgi:hypothetical protein
MTYSTTKDGDSFLHPRLFVGDPIIRRALLLGVAAILIWRGVWLLTDLFLLPDNLPVSGMLSITIGLIIFMIYNEVRI